MLLLFFLIIGVVYRLWLVSLIPQPFLFDQVEYHNIALNIMKYGLYTDSFRTPGFPMLVAVIYTLFHSTDPFYWKLCQALLDSLSAFLIFLTAKRIFNNSKASWVSFIIYLLNPFTAAFTGVLLTETLSVFLVALLFFLLLKLLDHRKLRYFAVIGFLSSYLIQVRPSFLIFSFMFLGTVLYILFKKIPGKSSKLTGIVLSCLFFLIPVIYTTAANSRWYGEFFPLSVNNIFVENLFLSVWVDRWPTHWKPLAPEAVKVFEELNVPHSTKAQRDAVAAKYLSLSLTRISNDPATFFDWRIKKLWYVWEKHYVYWYGGPETDNVPLTNTIYLANVLILISAVAGFIPWFFSRAGTGTFKIFGLAVILLIVYISAGHVFTAAEERYSIPGYPLIFLFAGYGIYMGIKKLSLLTHVISHH